MPDLFLLLSGVGRGLWKHLSGQHCLEQEVRLILDLEEAEVYLLLVHSLPPQDQDEETVT